MQIEISNYTKKIKKNILLDNINIKMESGKIYGMGCAEETEAVRQCL